MTQEQKKLLLKDLCSRLPYGVKVQIDLQSNTYPPMTCKVCNIEFAENGGSFIGVEVSSDSYNEYREFLCKPYLFPLSSMTDEQEKELSKLGVSYGEYALHDDTRGLGIMVVDAYIFFEFCYKHHIDFLGLIDMGLAIDCTNLNIY